ncbi:hypothetical protein SAMN05428939_7585 [Streptomyces sp. TLI_105]|nr:hypothetical protein SAMN05428939_7585 [Streptomyces sp. TLI_105]
MVATGRIRAENLLASREQGVLFEAEFAVQKSRILEA